VNPLPDQPAKVDPLEGAAAKVTAWPCPNWAEQMAPQPTSTGLEVTVPEPVPARETVSSSRVGARPAVDSFPTESSSTHVALVGQPSAFGALPPRTASEVHDPAAMGPPSSSVFRGPAATQSSLVRQAIGPVEPTVVGVGVSGAAGSKVSALPFLLAAGASFASNGVQE
jgi:hypothetical protein